LDLAPGVLVFKQHIALSLGRIHFLLIGAQVRSCWLVGRLSLCSAKCILRVVPYRAFKYHRNQCSNCEKKSRERGVDCMNQAHRTRNSSLYVKVNVLLYSPREGSRRLLCPVPSDKWHMQVARLSALRIGRLYPRIDPETTNPVYTPSPPIRTTS